MIQGFKIQVTTAELRDRLADRIAYHRGKEKHYAAQVASLLAGGDRVTGHSNDPVGSLQKSEKDHNRRAELLTFMRDHLVKDETYQLDENDLIKLEIIDRGW